MTRSHPEMVGDISRVTLNFNLSKIFLCVSSQGQDLYSHQKLNMYVYWERLGLQTPTTTTPITMMMSVTTMHKSLGEVRPCNFRVMRADGHWTARQTHYKIYS